MNKLKDDELYEISRKYFYGGFLFLPLLWIVHVGWLLPFMLQRAEKDQRIMRMLWISLAGALFWIAVFVAWGTIYLTHRSSWGVSADRFAVFVPLGY